MKEKLIPIIVLQTIAANLGSMLTPVGNPQNLYLYTVSGMELGMFVFFFVLIGNPGRISAIHQALQRLIQGREVLVSFFSCQFISNVPAAVLLSEFTDRYDLLLAGVNIGGLGTLIASMASLISYKYFAQIPNAKKGKFLLWFTLANVLFAGILLWLAAFFLF